MKTVAQFVVQFVSGMETDIREVATNLSQMVKTSAHKEVANHPAFNNFEYLVKGVTNFYQEHATKTLVTKFSPAGIPDSEYESEMIEAAEVMSSDSIKNKIAIKLYGNIVKIVTQAV